TRLRQLGTSETPDTDRELQELFLAQRPQRRNRPYLVPMIGLLGHLVALEALKLLSTYTPSSLRGRMLIQDLVSLETTTHTIIRMPWCEICGGAAQQPTPE